MNEAQMAHIDDTFAKLHQDAARAYRSVYDDIQRQLRGSSGRGLSGEIAQLEAKNLNQEILKLTGSVKQAAIEAGVIVKQFLESLILRKVENELGRKKSVLGVRDNEM